MCVHAHIHYYKNKLEVMFDTRVLSNWQSARKYLWLLL